MSDPAVNPPRGRPQDIGKGVCNRTMRSVPFCYSPPWEQAAFYEDTCVKLRRWFSHSRVPAYWLARTKSATTRDPPTSLPAAFLCPAFFPPRTALTSAGAVRGGKNAVPILDPYLRDVLRAVLGLLAASLGVATLATTFYPCQPALQASHHSLLTPTGVLSKPVESLPVC